MFDYLVNENVVNENATG